MGAEHRRLAEEFADHLAAVDDFDRPADAAHVFVVGVDAERVVDRAEQVGDRHRPLGDFGAGVVGGADHLPAADAAAGQRDVERLAGSGRGRRGG